MIANDSRSFDIGKWLALLIAGLAYFTWTSNQSWIVVTVLIISTLSLVGGFIYFHNEDAIRSYFRGDKRDLPMAVHYSDDHSYVNYTNRDLIQFESSHF
jgi:hypothetical protein